MHSSAFTFFVTLALAISAAASPVTQRGGVARRASRDAAKEGAAIDAVLGSPDATTAKAPTDPKALQDSLTLSPSVIQNTDNGQNPPVTGQSPADTSKNNFANICALTLPRVPLTNGLQITTGSCNPIPIGHIPNVNKMPSSKFQSPKNLDTIAAGQTFAIVLQVQGMQLGTFTNAQKTYFANPQKLNADGQIIGHTHIVVEAMDSLTSTRTTDPKSFVFFKGVNTPQDRNRNVQVDVNGGLKPGVYRMCTITSSHTHQPAIVPIAQHGSLDDCVYFTATPGGVKASEAAEINVKPGVAAQTATTKTAATPAKATTAVKKVGGK